MLFCLIFMFYLTGAISDVQQSPLVKLPLGIIEGSIQKTVNGKDIYAFEGIPYALPPTGDLRFEEPLPPKEWKGIWPAKTKYMCMQYDHYTPPGPTKVVGDEDCLYVNIYTPNLNPKKKLDVLIYIHGGAFMFNHGGQTYPDIVLDRNIVFVNLNYRLGPLGFLSTEDKIVPGNNGIRDQVAALKFIKENIEYFGGDSNSITISGMSAGGASVQTHYLTPLSKGLFSKGISQSGVTLNAWVLMEKGLEKTKRLASSLGCSNKKIKEVIKCLKSRPARQILYTIKHFQPWLYNPFSPFGLVVDSWANDPVFPQHPYLLLKNGLVQDLPWMISYTSAEGLYPGADFHTNEHLEYVDKNWNKILPYILHYNDVVPTKLWDEVGSKIRKEYLGDEPVNKNTFKKFIQILSDRLFIADIELASRLYMKSVKSSVYSYYFNYRGSYSKTNARTGSIDIGVSHGHDTAYVFKMFDVLSSEADRKISKLMVDMFVSFMNTGKPNITSDWEPLSKTETDPWIQLRVDGPDGTYIETINNIGNRKFWESLPFEENKKIFNEKDEL